MKQQTLAEAMLCVSMANLCLLRVIVELPPFLGQRSLNLQSTMPGHLPYTAYLILLLTLSLILWAATFMRRTETWPFGKHFTWLCWALACVAAANSVRHSLTASFGFRLDQQTTTRLVVSGSFAAALVATAFFYRWAGLSSLVRHGRALLLAFFWLAPCNVILAGWYLLKPTPGHWADGPAKIRNPNSRGASMRVVYILLDEWDYYMTYEARRADIEGSAFDELTQSSFFAANAVPPGANTITSVPSLLAGERFTAIEMAGPNRLLCRRNSTERAIDFRATGNIFENLTRQGFSVGLAGWYLPYCRIASGQYTECKWWEGSFDGYPKAETLAQSLALNARGMFESNSRSLFGAPAQMEIHLNTQRELFAYTHDLALNGDIDFVFTHLPFLHGPYYYDRKLTSFALRGSPASGYWDAMDRTSRLLGELITSISQSPVGRRTIVVITSDHPYRYAESQTGRKDKRVPFLVKFPFDTASRIHKEPLQTEDTTKLISFLMTGRIATPEAFADALSIAQH